MNPTPQERTDPAGDQHGIAPLLFFVFFLSGAAALSFETLWFRQAGLALGNSVWASSLVLAGFMAGLALGNGLAARLGHRVRRPARLYAYVELTIAVTGLGLVHLLPSLTPLLAPLLRPFVDFPWLLNPLRLGAAFALLVVPSTAMGITLPLLVAALLRRDPSFGAVLGRVYGWNTLGAVVGALVGDALLIEVLGIRGTGLAAASLSTTAALLALHLSRRLDAGPSARRATGPASPVTPLALGLLAAAFLLGATLLALEVVWFRFLLLFVDGTSLAFSAMLAAVLAGIGSGALVAARWLSARPEAQRNLPVVTLATGVVCVLSYAGFDAFAHLSGDRTPAAEAAALAMPLPMSLVLGLQLTFPVSMLSGALFTLVGEALHREVPGGMRAAGLLTLSNTTGAMLGALAGGFVLLPVLGIEASLRLLAAGYGVAAALLLAAQRPEARPGRAALVAAAAVWVAAIGLFPAGILRERFLRYPTEPFVRIDGEVPIEIREGLNETIIYMRRDRFGEPFYYRMLTNGHSMSGTDMVSRRYMKLFVYLPIAVHPTPRHALLISYGVGSTAKALTDTKGLETIDVVDISKDVLEMGRIVYGDSAEHPLRDPRVRVHIEDGRYFLQTTERRFDLITSEPPPPALAGVVNLYTREYFDLVHERLAEGGIVTYWLPTWKLAESAAKAVIGAFCDVFEDCSLWNAAGPNWMLVGTRGARGPVTEERFAAQWRDPSVALELAALGLEVPEQLGALFLADAEDLREWAGATAPLVDDRPKRLLRVNRNEPTDLDVRSWVGVAGAGARFERSRTVAQLWPATLRLATLGYFDVQKLINRFFLERRPEERDWESLHRILAETRLETLAMWELGSGADEVRLARAAWAKGRRGLAVRYNLAVGALATRHYEEAAQLFQSAQRSPGAMRDLLHLRILALCMAGRIDEAQALAGALEMGQPADSRFARFAATRFRLEIPAAASSSSDP